MNTDMQVIKVAPGAEPEEVIMDIPEVAQAIGSGKWRCGPFRPFGDKIIVDCALEAGEHQLPFNRIVIDGNGQNTFNAYSTILISRGKLGMTPDEIAMYKHLFSLEECAKPIEERIKTIKEYFPNGVEGVLMPDPNSIPEANRKYITHPTDTPSYTRPVTPSRTPAVPVKNKDYTPHCPICGSPDIEKITLAQKAFGGIMFGLFSKTAKSQFKCNNCGAKF